MFASPVNYRVFVRVMELWSLTAISRQAAKLKSIYITKCDIMNYFRYSEIKAIRSVSKKYNQTKIVFTGDQSAYVRLHLLYYEKI
jgi:hypothetical protein